MSEKKTEESFGELPTLGNEETARAKMPAGEGPSWTALGLSEANTLKPLKVVGGIVDDGRTDGARRWKAGEEILGRYVVERELGQGGMGVVYGCLDKVGGVRVAVKGLPPELSHDSVEMEEVRENFRLVGDLRHPCIAGVRTLEKDERGEFYLVMDLAEGESLRKWERSKWKAGGVSLAEAVSVLRQVATALDYAHGEKVVHRDVKPGNVMIDGKGRVKVLDFGLADQIRTSLSRASHAYRGTSGTGPYMSPEQWRGQPQDGKTDQYALGVMAYEMLAGRLPFGGSDLGVLREVVLKEAPTAIPGLPESTMGAIRRAMAKRAEERFGSCGEFVEALEGKRKDRPTARPGQNLDSATAREGRGKKSQGVAGWLTALLLVSGVGGGWWWWQEAAARRIEGEATRRREEAAQTEQKAAELEVLKGEVYNLAAQAKSRAEETQRINHEAGQGFGTHLTAMKDYLGRGEAALQGQDFEKAKEYFGVSLAAAGWVETNAPLRKKALVKKQASEAARQKADGMEASRWCGMEYMEGTRMQADADAAFANGEFEAAAESWGAAETAYGKSAIEARSARVAKGLENARRAKERGEWKECWGAAGGVLALDEGNTEALTLQEAAKRGARDAKVAKGLETARNAKARGAWQECATAADGVLALDAGNAEAEALKEDSARGERDAKVALELEKVRAAKDQGLWHEVIKLATDVLSIDEENSEAVELKAAAEKALAGMSVRGAEAPSKEDVVELTAQKSVRITANPAQLQTEAYIHLVQGDQFFDSARLGDALHEYQTAKHYYERLANEFPDWEPRVVRYRSSYCDKTISEIEAKLVTLRETEAARQAAIERSRAEAIARKTAETAAREEAKRTAAQTTMNEAMLTVARSGGEVTLAWTGSRGVYYTVMWAQSNGKNARWQPLPDVVNVRVAVDGERVIAKDRIPASAERYYRLVQGPQPIQQIPNSNQ